MISGLRQYFNGNDLLVKGTININNNFKKFSIYVVVNFLSQVIFLFLFFFGMVMYANEVQHISFCDEFSNQKIL